MNFKVDRKFTILKHKIDEAVDTLYQKNYGLHVMVVYPNLDILRKFYTLYVKKEIKENNGMVVIASFYETTDSVRSNLSSGIDSLDIKYLERNNVLVILDSSKFYSSNDQTVKFIDMIAHHAKKKIRMVLLL